MIQTPQAKAGLASQTATATRYAVFSATQNPNAPNHFLHFLYLIYTVFLTISLGYTIKIHTTFKILTSTSSYAPSSPERTRLNADSALYLAISYTVISIVFIIGNIFYTFASSTPPNPVILLFVAFVNLILQLVSFGILNQSPAYASARAMIGKINLRSYQGVNGFGIGLSLIILFINGGMIYQKSHSITTVAPIIHP